MSDAFFPRVGGILSADIAVPEHEREVRFYSRVLTTGEIGHASLGLAALLADAEAVFWRNPAGGVSEGDVPTDAAKRRKAELGSSSVSVFCHAKSSVVQSFGIGEHRPTRAFLTNCSARNPRFVVQNRVCGRNSVVECQLPKLDVGGSNPLARCEHNLFAERYLACQPSWG